jgi:hypothetical protein
MDTAIETLQAHKDEWVAFSVRERIALIDRLIRDFAAIVSRWVDASIQAKGSLKIRSAPVKNGPRVPGQYSKICASYGKRLSISKLMGIPKYLGVSRHGRMGRLPRKSFHKQCMIVYSSKESELRFGWNQV